MQGISVRIADGNLVTVPAGLSYLSTYVLLEQEDWFEKELPFVRSFLQPGMRALDIGANHGVYSVGMGKAVGSAGHVWAFEPSSGTIRFLRDTLACNHMTQVETHDCALSDHSGQGLLSTQTDSEFNSLLHGSAATGEAVRVDTLDNIAHRLGIQGIDFVKLDAEGEEVRIVAGGQQFFRTEDPLVMFELRHGHAVNAGLLECVRAAGYQIFRLIGPSSLLVPIDTDSAFDAFELNLFACKPSRAAKLEQQGLLLTARPATRGGEAGSGLALFQRQPFAWQVARSNRASGLLQGLDAYALWRQDGATAATRYGALLRAFECLEAEAQRNPSLELLSLLARVAHDAGARMRTVQLAGLVLNETAHGALKITEPTWPAAARYDTVAAVSDTGGWLTAATAEALINASTFSNYFTGASTLALLDRLKNSPYVSAPMERRRQLQQLQAKRTTSIESVARLSDDGPDHRNAEFWRLAAADRSTMPAGLVRPLA